MRIHTTKNESVLTSGLIKFFENWMTAKKFLRLRAQKKTNVWKSVEKQSNENVIFSQKKIKSNEWDEVIGKKG